jgi:hypothetical protein
MTQDIINLSKMWARKAWAALTHTPPPLPPRPQLAGRRGYGDGPVKPPE